MKQNTFNTMNIKAPCFKCKDRKVGCHAACIRWAKYKAVQEHVKQKRDNILRDDREFAEYLSESIGKRIRRYE